ncbi:MAG: glycosyltransferase family 2 protein [Acidimicrobiales bacterium]
MPFDSVSVVVVTWNSASTIVDCLQPLAGQPDLELIVVDNDSADDTLAVARGVAPHATLLTTGGNCGFATGVNAGAEHATGDVLVLLNPDAVATAEGLRRLAACVRRGAAIAAPRITDERGTTTRSVRKRPTVRDQFVVAGGLHRLVDSLDPDDDDGASTTDAEMTVDVVSGACFATGLERFRELGGLDERFFLYAEEVDYCARVADAGGQIVYDPQVAVAHIGGASAEQVESGTDFLLMESRVRWFDKHRTPLATQAVRFALAVWALRRRDRAALRAMARPMARILEPTHPRADPTTV